jgi:hypothetical protein
MLMPWGALKACLQTLLNLQLLHGANAAAEQHDEQLLKLQLKLVQHSAQQWQG